MSDLRKAAEMALEALRNAEVVHMEQLNAMYALQEALAEPEYVTEVVAMHENGTYTTKRTPIQQREVWCDCGDGIMPNSGAKCGNCIAADNCIATDRIEGLTEALQDMVVAFGGGGVTESHSVRVQALNRACQILKEKNT